MGTLSGVYHTQNAMNASSYRIVHHMLPIWECLVRDLSLIFRDVAHESNFSTPHELSQKPTKCLTEKVKSIEAHGLWTVDCIMCAPPRHANIHNDITKLGGTNEIPRRGLHVYQKSAC